MRKQTPKQYEKITISFTDADDDIVDFVKELKKSSKASEFIREAIREKIKRANSRNESRDFKEILERVEKLEAIIINSDSRPSNPSKSSANEKQETELITDNKPTDKIRGSENLKEEISEEKEDEDISLDSDISGALDYFDF